MLQQARFQQSGQSWTLRIPSLVLWADMRHMVDPGQTVVSDGQRGLVGVYFNSEATLSMPALAQASSLSPPGAPETPTAPMVSLPTLIGSAPCAGTMLDRYRAPAVGLFLMVAANSPDGRLMVRAVWAFFMEFS